MGDNDLETALSEYFAECEEILARVADLLRVIERDEFTSEHLDALYRDIHTVKGTSQLFSFQDVGQLAHAMEASLESVRRLQRKPAPSQIEALYVSLDLIEKMILSLKAHDPHDYQSEIQRLVPRLLDTALELLGPVMQVVRETSVPVNSLSFSELESLEIKVASDNRRSSMIEDQSTFVRPTAALRDRDPVSKPATAQVTPTPPVPTVPATSAVTAPAASNAGHGDSDSASTIRVPVSLLDKLMTLMGEMVLVRNQVLQYANKSDDFEFLNLSQRLDVVTSEIQGEVMKTRMQPISNVLSKFHRVVRDLSRDLNKKIDLILVGSETEVDKTLLEAVKDPIMHIVRNSCDHGIETPEQRRAAGKSEHGTVTVCSFHEGGQVVVEISDDGRGLNREKLTSKAIEKGLLTTEKAQHLSDRDAFGLIFAAGFSTAAAVTNVSGRGVGMDVVKTNIEGIGGTVEVHSTFGHGMKIRLKIPLTLAIVPAMIVRCAQDLFAIPQVKLVELVRVEEGSSVHSIERLQGQRMYRLRGNLLPLVSLDEVLGIDRGGSPSPDPGITNIVVLSVENQMFGLIVDEVQDTAEVVVKPLTGFLKSLSVYSGATVLGDGSVALILDVMGLAQKCGLLREDAADAVKYAGQEADAIASEEQEFLLFRLNSPTRHAVPLNLVHRLEEFSRTAVEYSGSQRVVRYREMALPIISLNEQLELSSFAGANPGTPSEASALRHPPLTHSVIVIKKNDRLYGLEVDEILDVLETNAEMDDGVVDRAGIFGNIVTEDEIVVIVDAIQIIEHVAQKLGVKDAGDVKSERGSPVSGKGISVLFAEDTAFFRKHVRASLEKVGFRVTCVINGQEALDLLTTEPAPRFDLVLSDIEMPKMTGLQLATEIRKLEKWKQIPLIALTTKFSDFARQEGQAAGFDEYLEKLKVDELMRVIARLLPNRLTHKRDVA